MAVTKEDRKTASTGTNAKTTAASGRLVSTSRAAQTAVSMSLPRMAGIRPQPFERGERIRQKIGFNQQEFAGFLGIDPRTYSRRAEAEELKNGESLKVEMLDEILGEASRVFRDEDLARKWLHSSIIGLDNKRPLDHLNSIEGYERIKDTLGKIEYGMY